VSARMRPYFAETMRICNLLLKFGFSRRAFFRTEKSTPLYRSIAGNSSVFSVFFAEQERIKRCIIIHRYSCVVLVAGLILTQNMQIVKLDLYLTGKRVDRLFARIFNFDVVQFLQRNKQRNAKAEQIETSAEQKYQNATNA